MFGLKRDGTICNESNDPVNSADDWLAREGHTTWPLPIASEGELDLSLIEGQLETKESIMQDLRDHSCILFIFTTYCIFNPNQFLSLWFDNFENPQNNHMLASQLMQYVEKFSLRKKLILKT